MARNVTTCRVPGGRPAGRYRDGALDDLCQLFEKTLEQYCLGPWQYMGNNTRPYYFLDDLLRLPWGDEANALTLPGCEDC